MTQIAQADQPVAAPPAPRAWHRRWLGPALVYAVLILLCALAAYWAMFSQLGGSDDEGFFDYSLKLFVGGHPLYSSGMPSPPMRVA